MNMLPIDEKQEMWTANPIWKEGESTARTGRNDRVPFRDGKSNSGVCGVNDKTNYEEMFKLLDTYEIGMD